MRIFTASLATETYTFSPIPTDRASFGYAGPGRHPDVPTLCSAPIVALRRSNEPTFRNTVRRHFAV